MSAYSKALRLKVRAAVDRGVPRREVVGNFGVSLAVLKRWLKRRSKGGYLSPRPSPGRTPIILDAEEERRASWAQLEANDDAALEPLRDVGAREGRGGVGGDNEPGGEDARVDLQESRWRSPSGTRGSGGPGVGA